MKKFSFLATMILLYFLPLVFTVSNIWEWSMLVFFLLVFILLPLNSLPLMQMYLFFWEELFSLSILFSFIIENSSILPFFVLSKLAIPPLHLWAIWLVTSGPWSFLKLFFTFYKLPSVILFISVNSSPISLFLFMMLLTSFLILLAQTARVLLFFSGAMNLLWVILMFSKLFILSLAVLLFYFTFILNLMSETSLMDFTLFLIILGVPPFVFFLMKVFSFQMLSAGGFLLSVFLFFWVFAIFSYLSLLLELYSPRMYFNRKKMFGLFSALILLLI